MRIGALGIVNLAVQVALAPAAPGQPVVRLEPGMVISRSVRIAPGTYRLDAPRDSTAALVTIRGSNITVDFAGATLLGADAESDPDRAAGVAIRIDSGRRVTLRNARIHGFKVAVLARGVRDLRILDNDLSRNWKPRLYSLVEHESLVDWLSYHHNEKDEWLRHGAALYLSGVRGGEVRGNTIEQGMNGVMMTRTDSLLVWNNAIRFNSGIGIGLYRSSDNRVMHNRVDYAVRGYSHGFYRRGQDSAGILVYEQSCRNVFAYNSVTHGGDGFFLWAGQHTMDTGEGGANDNVLYMNDFSHAPTNGIEVTFSRNVIVGNRVEENDHGIWGGYSYETVIAGNTFARNRIGIAIEHGQDNAIISNRFDRDSTGIRLWRSTIEPGDWGYPKRRDTRSRDYRVQGNTATGLRTWLRVSDTQRLLEVGNMAGADTLVVAAGDTSGFRSLARQSPPLKAMRRALEWRALAKLAPRNLAANRPAATSPREWAALARAASHRLPAELPGGLDAFLPDSTPRGRSTIIVDEWGPYDWRSPKLWPEARSDARPLPLRVLGPVGEWRVVSQRGIASLSVTAGAVPGRVVVTPDTGAFEDWELVLEYRGAATRSPRGTRAAAGTPVTFRHGVTAPRTSWQQRIVAWADGASDPRTTPDAFDRALRSGPALLERTAPALDFMWYRPQVSGIPLTRWAMRAESRVEVPAGTWRLRTISDDGIRAWIDGRLAIDAWKPHESQVDSAPISAGHHTLRVEYYQVDGWTELRLDIVRAPSP
ncbi:MAG: right-handed parallel beta-helix repeat-containing protein [Gemmatimonadetes bacterium]|nr:right-handed parallel beta-helix repeat-containing protein [Gemmatimonadota bacterium]